MMGAPDPGEIWVPVGIHHKALEGKEVSQVITQLWAGTTRQLLHNILIQHFWHVLSVCPLSLRRHMLQRERYSRRGMESAESRHNAVKSLGLVRPICLYHSPSGSSCWSLYTPSSLVSVDTWLLVAWTKTWIRLLRCAGPPTDVPRRRPAGYLAERPRLFKRLVHAVL